MQTVATNIELIDHEPSKRACSLLHECDVEPGVGRDYKLLARYHYRNTGFPPAVKQIYRAVHTASGRVVGAIVYARPSLNLGVRNQIFGDRYKIGGGVGTNDIRSARLNNEMELIIRVVVHPTFRGIGLGVRLVKETLGLRPTQYVESSAAMGSINPFFEKAGMTAVAVPVPKNTARVLGALRSVGMTDEQMANPSEIVRVYKALRGNKRKFIEDELFRFAMRWIKSRTNRAVSITVEDAARRVSNNALLRTTYYLWENPHVDQSDEAV